MRRDNGPMTDRRSPAYVAVIGPGSAVSPQLLGQAHEVGRLLAVRGAVVLTGGLGGIMAAASRGAYEAGGTTVGLLPGPDRGDGNPYLTVALPTGLGELRNGLLVRSADAVVAVGCSWGTLSEIALAVRTGVPVAVIDCWDLPDGEPRRVTSAAEAVAAAFGAGEGPAEDEDPHDRPEPPGATATTKADR